MTRPFSIPIPIPIPIPISISSGLNHGALREFDAFAEFNTTAAVPAA
jgi:hypothetical protein